jgi:hypothetical protein
MGFIWGYRQNWGIMQHPLECIPIWPSTWVHGSAFPYTHVLGYMGLHSRLPKYLGTWEHIPYTQILGHRGMHHSIPKYLGIWECSPTVPKYLGIWEYIPVGSLLPPNTTSTPNTPQQTSSTIRIYIYIHIYIVAVVGVVVIVVGVVVAGCFCCWCC